MKQRSPAWVWTVCGLLLLASAINYMDRQTLVGASVRISAEFGLTQAQYGQVEEVFGYAFAAGSIVFGWLADRHAVRWLYAAVLLLWSVAGIVTGLAETHGQLIACRAFLGFFEAGHWPCAIRSTRMLLDERRRSFGNGLLQSGATLGAVLTPLVMRWLIPVGSTEPGVWRKPFLVVGVAGLLWLIPWLLLVGRDDLRGGDAGRPAAKASGDGPSVWSTLLSPRMLIVFFVIACINTTWQVLRAWMMKFLQQGRGYSESEALYFNSAWFVAADIGCIAAGALAMWLARRGMTVHRGRVLTFLGCAALCAGTLLIPVLGKGPALLGVLALVGAGALGVFPLYHSFTQDLPAEHQGRITGMAGVAGWVLPALAQRGFGELADATKSFDKGLMLAGLLPLLAVVPLWAFWGGAGKGGEKQRSGGSGG